MKDWKNKKEGYTPVINPLVYGKVPPQAVDLEAAALGGILTDQECIDVVMEILPTADHFYDETHRKIYSAIRNLYERGTSVDLLTVTNELSNLGELEMIGGAYGLTQLAHSVLSTAHVQAHCLIVKEKYISRQIIRLGSTLVAKGYDNTDCFELIEELDAETHLINNSLARKDYARADKVAKKVMMDDDELAKQPSGLIGIPTGNRELDELTGGFKKAKMIVLAARPSVGKTSISLNICYNASVTHKIPGAFFSLEMENEDLFRILVSIDTGIDSDKVENPKIRSQDEQARIIASYTKIAASPLYFDDTASITSMELRAKARRLKKKHDIQYIFIDYLQLMKGDSNQSWNREAEIAKISRELKLLAKELQIPVIPLCQLNRDIEKRANNKFLMSDLRESGAIEQDADIIGFLWRPTEDDIKNDPSLEGIGKVDIAKHRRGKKKKVLYSTNMSCQRWRDYDAFASKPATTPTGYQQVDKPNAGFQNRRPGDINLTPESLDECPF